MPRGQPNPSNATQLMAIIIITEVSAITTNACWIFTALYTLFHRVPKTVLFYYLLLLINIINN